MGTDKKNVESATHHLKKIACVLILVGMGRISGLGARPDTGFDLEI